jgi:hypothetical protein
MKKLSRETADTVRKVQELAVYREEYIRKKGLPLSFIHTCRKIGVYPHTVKRHVPELYVKWADIDFHWEVSNT